MSCCSASVGFNRSHSSIMSRTGWHTWPEPSCRCHLYAPDQAPGAYRAGAHTLFYSAVCSFHTESASHVGLPAPGSTRDEQIPVLRDVLTGCETFDQAAVKLPAGSIVDISDVSFRLIEPGSLDQALQAVALRLLYSMSTRRPKRSSNGTSFILGSSICVIRHLT